MRKLSRARADRTARSLLYPRNIDSRGQRLSLEESYSVARRKRLYLQSLTPLGLLRLNTGRCGRQHEKKSAGYSPALCSIVYRKLSVKTELRVGASLDPTALHPSAVDTASPAPGSCSA